MPKIVTNQTRLGPRVFARVTADTFAEIEALAAAYRVTVSGVVRLLLEQAVQLKNNRQHKGRN